jgi:hypothetical protein
MGFALSLRELSRHRRLLALGALIAAVAAVFSVYRLEGLTLKARSLQYSSASTQVLVDSQSSVLGNDSQAFEPLAARAVVYANFMTTPAVLNLIGKQVGLSGEQIYAAGPVNANEPRVEQEPTALKRNVEITGETKPYRLNFESQANVPTITINSQAPTTSQAVALANAAAVGMQRYVVSVETANTVPLHSRVVIRQLGPASGAVVDGSISKSLAGMTFIAVFCLWCVLMLVAPRARAMWGESAILGVEEDEGASGADRPDRKTDGLDAAEVGPPRITPYAPEGAVFDTRARGDDDRAAVPARSAQ